jgi:hypothetical protein
MARDDDLDRSLDADEEVRLGLDGAVYWSPMTEHQHVAPIRDLPPFQAFQVGVHVISDALLRASDAGDIADVEAILQCFDGIADALTPWADARICTVCHVAIPADQLAKPGANHRGICTDCWAGMYSDDDTRVDGWRCQPRWAIPRRKTGEVPLRKTAEVPVTESRRRSAATARSRAVPDPELRRAIRAWGPAHGYQVAKHGFLSPEVVEAYAAANGAGS